MVIKVSTLLAHNTSVIYDAAPTLGGPLNTNNYPISNGANPVVISGNDYPTNTGSAGQVLTTNGFGILSWAANGTGTVTSVGVSSIGTYGPSLTIGSSPVTSAGTITITPNIFTPTTPGVVAGSGGGTINFLRADGTWATPPGGGGSGTVTSIGLTSSASTITVSGVPNPITTSGTFNVDLPLSGVTAAAYGSASSVGVFSVNSRGIITFAANSPITITPAQAGLGNVTNALQVINNGGSPSIRQGTGAPAGPDTLGAMYIDRSVTNGNGIYYYDGAVWQIIAQKLNLYNEKSSVFTAPVANGTNSIALGEGAQTASSAPDSLAIGLYSVARTQGEVVQASGRFSSNGDAQAGRYLLRGITITGPPPGPNPVPIWTELLVDGNGGSVRLVLQDNCTWTFKVTVTGHRTDVGDGHAGYTAEGVIYRGSGAANTFIQGRVNKTVLAESNPAWDINIDADVANGSLRVRVSGEALKQIRWVALVETVEITN